MPVTCTARRREAFHSMAQTPRSIRFFRKAEAALLASIELHNKPDFRYHEEAFTNLAPNAWELLLKAKLLADSNNRLQCLTFYQTPGRQNLASSPKRK